MRFFLTAGLTILASTSLLYAQGALTPPGAPAPTMKTLEEVYDNIGTLSTTASALQMESRTAISSLPYTISTSGSYYLTENLSTSSAEGITIAADNVTLDLNGFSIDGSSGSSGIGGGIFVEGSSSDALHAVRIKNGTITGFGRSVYLGYTQSCRLEKLTCENARNNGIMVYESTGARINNCHVSDSVGQGLAIQSSDGCFVKKCVISNAGISGFHLTSANGNFLHTCTSTDSGIFGISLGGNGNIVKNCVVNGSGSYGIDISGSSSTSFNGNCITENTVTNATGRGIYLTYATENKVIGNHISDTVLSSSTSYGIYCHPTRSQNNVVIKNTSVEHTSNYSFSTSDVYGPEATETELTSSLSTPHPFANISL